MIHQRVNFFGSVKAPIVLEVTRNGEEVIEKIRHARNLYDFTVSAPKDLSMQAMEDPRLVEAHKTAVTEMAVEMERLAGVRVRKSGANENRG